VSNAKGTSALVAMSGGVDSSVAAARLVEAGYDVTGVFMCIGQAGLDAETSGCCSPADAADARRVAGQLDIDMHVLNLADAFAPIIDYFLAEYRRGRTPNPCIHCNTRLKFGRLVALADSLGIDCVATGHYARIVDRGGRARLARGIDTGKDQSYALFGITPDILGRVVLPIGEMHKDQTRDQARRLGLIVHDKPDSQEICFVADDDYATLLAERAPEALRPGPILSTGGETLGRHDGYGRYTIGQRRGLGVAAGEPMYVVAIDPATAAVTIGTRAEARGVTLSAGEANWHERPGGASFRATAQIRYNHRGCPAEVTCTGPDTFDVRFDEPVHAITPGQAVVLYDGELLLGGGWIESAGPA
jgi:tRNA-specific 2-thiouridylase